MYHFIPFPDDARQTPAQIRKERVQAQKEAPILAVMLPLYIGFIFCFVAVSLFLK